MIQDALHVRPCHCLATNTLSTMPMLPHHVEARFEPIVRGLSLDLNVVPMLTCCLFTNTWTWDSSSGRLAGYHTCRHVPYPPTHRHMVGELFINSRTAGKTAESSSECAAPTEGSARGTLRALPAHARHAHKYTPTANTTVAGPRTPQHPAKPARSGLRSSGREGGGPVQGSKAWVAAAPGLGSLGGPNWEG